MQGLSMSTTFAVVLLATWTSNAAACPYCDSAIGRQVAAGIFDASFFWNAALVGMPIPILLALVLLIRFGPSLRGPEREALPSSTPYGCER